LLRALTVIPHRGARVGMAADDMDIAQVNTGVEHGCDKV
jgi:hypothetical protein